MKKLMMLLPVVLILAFRGNATSDYRPILEEGKSWVIDAQRYDFETSEWKLIEFQRASLYGKTTVNGEEAWILKKDYPNDENRVPHDVILKEQDRSLYYLDTDGDDDEWLPLIDFNYVKGDEDIPIYDYHYLIGYTSIQNEGYFTINGIERHYLELTNNEYWIEGIGSPKLFYLNMFPVPTDGTTDYHISKCYLGDTCIFDYEEFQDISGISEVDASEPVVEGPLYDILGRQVKETVPGSIYIRDRKKFVAK